MGYYEDIYLKRLNRYGLDYQSRIQGQRERLFEDYLLKSIYRIDFLFDGKTYPGTLERYKQDYTNTQCYLLTRISDVLAPGDIIAVQNQNGTTNYWLVWWLEQIESSGYNRYVVLRLNYELTWTDNGQTYSQWVYFYGPGTSKISDTIKSASGKVVFTENNNLYMLITAYNSYFAREQYYEINYEKDHLGVEKTDSNNVTITNPFVIKELDVNSSPGVEYITLDPALKRDDSPAPDTSDITDANNYWLNGGN